MKVRIKKWGNSLTLIIPKSFAAGLNITSSTTVEVSVENGNIVVRPVTKPAYTLDDLLEDVTDENLHGEIDWGPSVGSEIW